MISKATYISRRKRLLDSLCQAGEKGLAIFVGNIDAPVNYRGNDYKFRQDTTFLYLWGIDEPGFAAILDLDEGSECIYADDVELDDIIWTGPQDSVAVKAASFGVSQSKASSQFEADVRTAISQGRRIHFIPVTRYSSAIRLSSIIGAAPSEVVTNGKKGCALASLPLVKAVIAMRLVKTAEEIEEIDKACDIGYEMHSVARDCIRPGVIEQEIVGKMEGVTISKGWGTSFATILTQHGEIFHCHSHDCPIEEGRLLVIDAGAESNTHYASDFTRTYPTGGIFTPMQRDIYQTVADCNEYAFSLTKPGISYREVHLKVAACMLEHLKDLKLVEGDVQTMVDEGIAGLFMPHGLGHNLGMDVHDMEDYGEDLVGYEAGQMRSSQLGLGSLRMARPLQSGNIVTDEPGIYFIPDLIRQWKKDKIDKGCVNYSALEKYFNFGGIRLEDDVLITPDGARRLGSKRLPISIRDVEAAMKAAMER